MQYILKPIVINPDLKVTAQLKSKNNRPFLIKFLKQCLEIVDIYGLKLALETALDADEIIDLIDELNTTSVVL